MHGLFTPEGGEADPRFRIGLAPIAAARWFEGGEADPAPRKDALFASHPREVWGALEGSEAAQAEAAAMIAGFLGAAPPSPSAAPLRAAARRVADDLCLMERGGGAGGSEWTLTAASLCAPSFFAAHEVVGRTLSTLHAPVPGFGATLLARVARIFDRLAADVVLERRNWSVVNASALFLPSADPLRRRAGAMDADALAAELVVRRERQTIRRLPASGGVLFTIRIWREPLAELLAEPERRAAFVHAWTRLNAPEGEAFRTYKRLDLFDAAVARLLSRHDDGAGGV